MATAKAVVATMIEDVSPGSSGPAEDFVHAPVMLEEITELAAAVPAGAFVDLTLGGAGHAVSVLRRAEHVVLHGIDRDVVALDVARRRLDTFGPRAVTHHGRFDETPSRLSDAGVTTISGFLMDLGVSSPQLDVAERGFSFREDGPLDMRMDRSQSLTAAEVVNGYALSELIDVLRAYGDERNAKRIARAILDGRPFTRTAELARVVVDATPAAVRRNATAHPATRTFQAIRIEVNDELAILGDTIDAMLELLAPGGVGLVLSYHSGEDRIVKDRFRTAVEGADLPGLPSTSQYEWTFRGARTPTDAEIETNPRARSARLRSVRRIEA